MRLKDRNRQNERRKDLIIQAPWTDGLKLSAPFPLALLPLARGWTSSSTPWTTEGQASHQTAQFRNCCVGGHCGTSSPWCLGWTFMSYMLSVHILKFPWQSRQCFVSSLCVGRVPITIDEQAQRLQAFRNTWDVSSWPTSPKPSWGLCEMSCTR